MPVIDRIVQLYRTEIGIILRWRPGRRALIRRAIVSFIVTALSLAIASWLLPGFSIPNLGALALSVIVIWLASAIVRPVLLGVLAPFSVVVIGIAAVAFQVLVIMALVPLVPDVHVNGVLGALFTSLIVAVANSVLTFVLSRDDDNSYYGALVRQLARQRTDAIHTDVPGVLIVQIDGLSFPVLMHQIRAGRVPVMSDWVRSGKFRLDGWRALLPSQTSASQAGILHGNNDDIPAFRWWEKESSRLMVSNHPADAFELVRRVSDGLGLLCDDGASVGNLCSGDAVHSYLTMSTLTDKSKGLGQSQAFLSFFASPDNYLHTFVRTGAEAVKEVIQARRSERAGMVPRMHRGWPYPIVRGATNVVLRSLSMSLVMDEMMRGAPVIYVDFTDYDEIAHHSGPERAESLDALDGVDHVLGTFERTLEDTPRPYRFVILSDHGQSLGATFLQRYGKTLEQVSRDLMGGDATVAAATAPVEQWSGMTMLLSETSQVGGATGALTRRVFKGSTEDGVVQPGQDQKEEKRTEVDAATKDLVVCASGNLGLIYLADMPGRITEEQIEARYPRLIAGLVEHPGIGLLMIRSQRGPIAIGASGRRLISGSQGTGLDPTVQFGDLAIPSLLRIDAMPHCPDIVVLSLYEEQMGEVAAFEELIGSHGGLGGWQTEPFILHPSEWTIDEPLIGAPSVYRQMRAWLGTLGIGPEKVAAARAQSEKSTNAVPGEVPVVAGAAAPVVSAASAASAAAASAAAVPVAPSSAPGS